MKNLIKYTCVAACLLSYQTVRPQQNLNDVFAPTIVGVPPSDSFIGLSLMEDGEVRHYNYGEHPSDPHPLYLSSRDHGLSWKTVYLPYGLPYADHVHRSAMSISVFSARHKVSMPCGRKEDRKEGVPLPR